MTKGIFVEQLYEVTAILTVGDHLVVHESLTLFGNMREIVSLA